MGRLIFAEEFYKDGGLNPYWYFPDTCWSDGARRFSVRSGFPHVLAIHRDHFEEYRRDVALPIRLRRWIEDHLTRSVILRRLDLSYHHVWNPHAPSWEQRDEEVAHGYHLFHFEREADAVLFKLAHADLVVVPSPIHPDGRMPNNPWQTTRAKATLEEATGCKIEEEA